MTIGILKVMIFLVAWAVVAIHGKARKWETTTRFVGGFFIAMAIAIFASVWIDSEAEKNAKNEAMPVASAADKPAPEPAKVTLPPPPPVKKHNYSLQDGYEFGYERAISANDQQNGQATSSLVMARYAGQRDGKYQVYVKSEGTFTVVECTNPCEFMKTMTFYDDEFVAAQRLRVAPGIIGWMMLEDAINGELEQVVLERNKRKLSIWFDERKGVIITPLDSGATKKN